MRVFNHLLFYGFGGNLKEGMPGVNIAPAGAKADNFVQAEYPCGGAEGFPAPDWGRKAVCY
jgi:hypothetical protein